MRDVLYPDLPPHEPKDAYVASRSTMQKALPKRFYKAVGVEEGEGGFLVTLDGKRARTPGRNPLGLPVRAAAEILAAEWAAQDTHINPSTMHATRIANIGIDRVGAVRNEVIDDMAKYAGTDLVCYRAEGPEGLVACENAAWDPVLAHMRARYGVTFRLSAGIPHARQEPAALVAVRDAFARVENPVALAALHTLVTIAGSALIPLAFSDGVMDAETAFAAATVDEDWNARLWGEDTEAQDRRRRRHAEFMTAAALFRAL